MRRIIPERKSVGPILGKSLLNQVLQKYPTQIGDGNVLTFDSHEALRYQKSEPLVEGVVLVEQGIARCRGIIVYSNDIAVCARLRVQEVKRGDLAPENVGVGAFAEPRYADLSRCPQDHLHPQ